MAKVVGERKGQATVPADDPSFTERAAWESVSQGWRQLSGDFRTLGYSIEWHDFTAQRELDWSRSFHPASLEICLNLAGHGEVRAGTRRLPFGPASAGFYIQSEASLTGCRSGRQRHRFITVELAFAFLERHFPSRERGLNPEVNAVRRTATKTAAVSAPMRLSLQQQQTILTLRHPPVYLAAQPLWYQAKVLELAATLLYQPLPGEELFCQRNRRLSQERVQKVIAILQKEPAEPPALDELGRQVGCSPFYLSRLFSQEMGKTISVYLRELRLERAAALLREGHLNVTEAALAVGYSSLSHFSSAFYATFGCCPGLYPRATPAQRARLSR